MKSKKQGWMLQCVKYEKGLIETNKSSFFLSINYTLNINHLISYGTSENIINT